MHPDELAKVPQDIWQHLVARNGAWRTPVLASAVPGGGADVRTVVLRSASAAGRELVFFTDRRSRKLAQLQADPAVCLLVYDDERRLQARFYGNAVSEQSSAVLDDWWSGLAGHQRALYALDMLADGQSGDNEKGRENFAAFRVTVERFHCLWILERGNAAVQFDWQHGQWRGHPVRP